jgi:translation initiation factor 1
MSKKNKPDSRGFVYSTDPDFRFEPADAPLPETLPAAQQPLKVRLETKHRAGKLVTVVEGFIGTDADAGELGKQLKNYCGTGGSVKEGVILIQGDQREKIIQYLQRNGYAKARRI